MTSMNCNLKLLYDQINFILFLPGTFDDGC